MIRTDHKKIAKALETKGWKKEHISKVKKILEKGDEKSKQQTYIMILLFMILGNSLIIFSLSPLMIAGKPGIYLLFLGFFAVIFGYLLDRLLSEIDIMIHHYIYSAILLSLIITGCFFVSFHMADTLAYIFGLELKVNLAALIGFYLFFFYLPHIVIRCKHGSN